MGRLSHAICMTGTNVGSPKERELYGDAGLVVVVGVTPHRGGRESRPHGRRGPGDRIFEAGRYA
jgi:hypothetical protein